MGDMADMINDDSPDPMTEPVAPRRPEVRRNPPDRIVVKWCAACSATLLAAQCPPTPDCPSCMGHGTMRRVRYQLATRKGQR